VRRKFSVGKPEGKRLRGRSGRGWEDTIEMNLREIVYEGVVCIKLNRDRD